MTTTLLEEPVVRPSTSPSQRLRTTMAAVRVSLSWLGVRKTLTAEQKIPSRRHVRGRRCVPVGRQEAAGHHAPGLQGRDGRQGPHHRVVEVRCRLPYPEPGIRLIRQDQIETFNAQIESLKDELDEAVRQLDQHFADLKSAARDRLGSLYNPADYPTSLLGLFQVAWDYPSLEPPEYLAAAQPGHLPAGVRAGRGPFRRGGAARRAGVHRGAARPGRRT